MNCGGEIGNAEKYLKKLCENVGFEYMGVKEIVMPENYIALFDAPDENEASTAGNKRGNSNNQRRLKIQSAQSKYRGQSKKLDCKRCVFQIHGKGEKILYNGKLHRMRRLRCTLSAEQH